MTHAHPRTRARGSQPELPRTRVMLYAPATSAEVEPELPRNVVVQVGRCLLEVIAALVDDPPPRPQVLVIDLDALSPAELLHLHELRERGWFGTIIALGSAPIELRRSLMIDRVLPLPLPPGKLADAIGKIGFEAATTRLPVLGLGLR